MEMLMMKNEANPGRRRRCMGDEAPEGAISVKRRRRNVQANGTTTVKRSSKFRGVSKHRWTGRYEAHLWDKLSWNVTQKKKGKQGNSFILHQLYIYLLVQLSDSNMHEISCFVHGPFSAMDSIKSHSLSW